MSPAPFEVETEELGGGVEAVVVRGELDMNTAPELELALDRVDDGARLILDLSECEFIDSTGIAVVVRAWQRLDQGGGADGTGQMVVCCINHQVRRLLKITGLESSISVHEQRQSALAELGG